MGEHGMSDDTTSGESTPEDNELIRKLRQDLKDSKAETKTAGEVAVALVERSAKAAGLMPEGFKGLSDIFANEVDGELDTDSAAEWLKGRGFGAAPTDESADDEVTASNLERVTNLGGAVAAAGNLTPEDNIKKQLEDVITPGKYQSLKDVTAAVDAILNG